MAASRNTDPPADIPQRVSALEREVSEVKQGMARVESGMQALSSDVRTVAGQIGDLVRDRTADMAKRADASRAPWWGVPGAVASTIVVIGSMFGVVLWANDQATKPIYRDIASLARDFGSLAVADGRHTNLLSEHEKNLALIGQRYSALETNFRRFDEFLNWYQMGSNVPAQNARRDAQIEMLRRDLDRLEQGRRHSP